MGVTRRLALTAKAGLEYASGQRPESRAPLRPTTSSVSIQALARRVEALEAAKAAGSVAQEAADTAPRSTACCR